MLLVKVPSVVCQNACEFLNLDYIFSILQNKVSNMTLMDVSLTGNLLWSTVRLECCSLVISVKMGQIHTDYTEIRFVCSPFGHLHLSMAAFDSCKYAKLWNNKCRFTFQSGNRITTLLHQELEDAVTILWRLNNPGLNGVIQSLGRLGLLSLEKDARTKHRLHPQLSLNS